MIQRIRNLGTARAVAGAAAVLLVATVGVGAVAATTGLPTATAPTGNAVATSAPQVRGAHPAARFLLRRAVTADVTVRTKSGFETIHYVRGEVTAVTSDSLTITAADGTVATFTVTDTTRVRSGGTRVLFSRVVAGDKGLVLGTGTGAPYTAYLVVVRSPGELPAGPSGAAPATSAP